MAKKPYYITTAIAYASGKPHIGNTYEIVLADSIARYKRFAGYDVRFMTEQMSMDRRSRTRLLRTCRPQRNSLMRHQVRSREYGIS